MDNYIVYVITDSKNRITAIDSSAFLIDTTDWIQIDEGIGDKYHHAQGTYFEKGLFDENGVYNYKLVEGVVMEITDEEKEFELITIENASRIAELKHKLAETDYAVIKIAEGSAVAEEYADVISQRQAWRAEINELESA